MNKLKVVTGVLMIAVFFGIITAAAATVLGAKVAIGIVVGAMTLALLPPTGIYLIGSGMEVEVGEND